MVDPIIDGYIRNCERIDALEAAHIEAVLLRIGSPLVVCVDAAIATEVVLGSMSVELMKPEVLRALDHTYAGESD
jgi:hypothetical protein